MSTKRAKKGKGYRHRATANGADFFPTYHSLTRLLLEQVQFSENDVILEPCAGAGDIAKVITERYPGIRVIQIDLDPRADGVKKADFLTCEPIVCDYVVTNPPFTLFAEFLEKSSKCATMGIYMLCPLDYLFGIERYEKFYSRKFNGFALQWVRVFVTRPMFSPGNRPEGPIGNGMTTFCWMEFWRTPGEPKPPRISWLDTREFTGAPWHVDQLRMDK